MDEKLISRPEAISHGLKYYFTGEPCRRGHICKRRISNYECWECARQPSINRSRKHYRDNIEKKKEWGKQYYQKNKLSHNLKGKEWRQKNRESINAYFNKLYHNNLDHKIGVACRRMLSRVLKKTKGRKKSSTWQMLGYSRSELISHIEKQFVDGMSWGNYGEWHIDHKRSIVSMIKEGITDMSVINALENLQPLWASDNISKGARWNSM